jgi:hypothetical protein
MISSCDLRAMASFAIKMRPKRKNRAICQKRPGEIGRPLSLEEGGMNTPRDYEAK